MSIYNFRAEIQGAEVEMKWRSCRWTFCCYSNSFMVIRIYTFTLLYVERILFRPIPILAWRTTCNYHYRWSFF